MIGSTLRTLKKGVGEFFLLREEERSVAAVDDSRRASVRAYFDAGARRLAVARDVRALGYLQAAVTLYRESVQFFAGAFLGGSAELEAPLSQPKTLDEVRRTLERRDGPLSAQWSSADTVLADDFDVLELDRMTADRLRGIAADLEYVALTLAQRIDPRSPSDVRAKRRWRIGTLVAAAAVLVAVLIFSMLSRIFSLPNVALHKPVKASSHAWDTVPEGAVDGETSHYGFHSDSDESPWLAIDLGRPYAVQRIKVYGRPDCCFDQSIPLAVELSDDGETYRQVAERADPFWQWVPWVVKLDSTPARFVRLRTKRHSVLVLAEVEVFGPPLR